MPRDRTFSNVDRIPVHRSGISSVNGRLTACSLEIPVTAAIHSSQARTTSRSSVVKIPIEITDDPSTRGRSDVRAARPARRALVPAEARPRFLPSLLHPIGVAVGNLSISSTDRSSECDTVECSTLAFVMSLICLAMLCARRNAPRIVRACSLTARSFVGLEAHAIRCARDFSRHLGLRLHGRGNAAHHALQIGCAPRDLFAGGCLFESARAVVAAPRRMNPDACEISPAVFACSPVALRTCAAWPLVFCAAFRMSRAARLCSLMAFLTSCDVFRTCALVCNTVATDLACSCVARR